LTIPYDMDVRPPSSRSVNRDGLNLLVGKLRSSFELFEGLNDCVVVYAPDGRWMACNRKAAQLVGYEPAELQGQMLGRFVVESEKARIASLFAATLRGEAPPELETHLVHADGSSLEIMLRLVPATFDGEIVGVYGIASDLRAQRSIERVFANNAQKYRSLFEHHTDAIVIVDALGRLGAINIAAENLSGYLNEEVVHRPVDIFFDADVPGVLEGVAAASKHTESTRYVLPLRRKDGTQVDVEGETIPIIIDGVVTGFFAVSRDVTERIIAAEEISTKSRRIHQLYRIASSVKATPDEQIVRALELGLEELGYEWATIGRVENGMLTVTHSVGGVNEFGVGFTEPLEDSIVGYAIAKNEMLVIEDASQPPWSNYRPGRSAKFGSFVGVPIHHDGAPGSVALFGSKPRLLSETDRDYIAAIVALATTSVARNLHHERLDALAFADTLTNLPNRLLFMDRLEQQLNFAKRQKRSFAVLYVDFDRFKAVNDTYGHAIGDAFLIEMGARFLGVARESDTVARLGGDEFVILQPEITDAERATEFATRLIAATRAPLVIGDVRIVPSISIGISVYPHDGTNSEALLGNADTALYCVKETGRNSFALYDPKMEARPRPRGMATG